MRKALSLFTLVVAIAALATGAHAVIVPLASPASFTAPTVEPFQGTQAYTSSYAFATGMTYLNLTGGSDLINLAGNYGLGQSGNVPAGRGGAGDRYFGAGSSPTTFKLSFAAPGVTGFGFYGAEAFNSGSALQNASLSLEFYDASDNLLGNATVLTPGAFSWTPFFGFASDGAPIGSVIFREAGYMVMDDVHFGAATVPEPASALSCTLLALLAARPPRRPR